MEALLVGVAILGGLIAAFIPKPSKCQKCGGRAEADEGCSFQQCRSCCVRTYSTVPKVPWSRQDHYKFPKATVHEAKFVLLLVNRRYPSLKHVARQQIIPYIAWNAQNCRAHRGVCHYLAVSPSMYYAQSNAKMICQFRSGVRCDTRCCTAHCKAKWCGEHGNPLLCRNCCDRSKTVGCVHHFCKNCCQGKHALFCGRHANRCRAGDCDALEIIDCNQRMCATCCKLAWCNAHGDPFCCRKCTAVAFDDQCSNLLCRSCCKLSRKYTECQTHHTLCIGQGCLHQQDRCCLSSSCQQCCRVAWCPVHGNPSICRCCAKLDFDSGCNLFFCSQCCKRRGKACDSCKIHASLCMLCKNKRSRKCDNRCCGKCCTNKWCREHGNPMLCRKCATTLKDNGCKSNFCSKCCNQRGQCYIHFGCTSKQVGCLNWRDTDCTTKACRNCCQQTDCFHSLCVSGACKNKANTMCATGMCARCCRDFFCDAHGNPTRCRRCKKHDYGSGCSQKYCQTCCSGSIRAKCPLHKCHCAVCASAIGVRDIGCRLGCCAICCKERTRTPSDCTQHGTRWFGSFVCSCGKKWSSAYAYKGWMQQCRSCKKHVYGCSFVAHTGGSEKSSDKPHDSAGCERCRSGNLCRSNF